MNFFAAAVGGLTLRTTLRAVRLVTSDYPVAAAPFACEPLGARRAGFSPTGRANVRPMSVTPFVAVEWRIARR